MPVVTTTVLDAGCGVPTTIDGEVVAAGEGWCWLLSAEIPVHLTGPQGERGPLTVRSASPPVSHPGEHIRREVSVPRWRAPSPPAAGTRAVRREAAARLSEHLRADLAVTPRTTIDRVIELYGGRGPGLTPEGDDLLMGMIAGRRAVHGAARSRSECEAITRWAVEYAGEPSRALLMHAAHGELGESAHRVLDALLVGDAEQAAAALPDLLAWGSSSGRALFTGLCVGVSS